LTGRRAQRPRDPQARREALAAAVIETIAAVGIDRTTHRAVAARAGLPLGATTYYFPTLDDLIAAGLRQVAGAVDADLRAWSARLAEGARPESARQREDRQAAADAGDLAHTLAELVRSYLADRRRARIEYELYVAAARDPGLRPLAEAWLHGLHALLEPHVGAPAARDVSAFLDGVMLQALVTGGEPDTAAVAATIRRLTPARPPHARPVTNKIHENGASDVLDCGV
jgi:DNA-binding transcriptional regulator YbjK